MPVHVRFMAGTQRLSAEQARRWVGQVGKNIPNDPATQTLLPTFLAHWSRMYGFLQQNEFLSDLAMYVDQTELLRGIRDVGARIIRDYPPQTYLYVGVGRSPAPIIAYFANVNIRAMTIPLSDFRPRNVSWSITDEELTQWTPGGAQGRPRLAAHQQAALFQHFQGFFPVRPPRNRVLLIDYTQSAQSLIAAQEQLQLFFKGNQNMTDIEVHALAICRDSDEAIVRAVGLRVGMVRSSILHPVDWYYYTEERQAFARRWHVLPIAQLGLATRRQNLVMSALSGQRFDALAEYGSFPILNGAVNMVQYTNDPRWIAAYDALREELRNADN